MRERSARATDLLLVAAAAAAARAAWGLFAPAEPCSDVWWYDAAARHLARSGDLVFPGPGEGSRAWFPPGWPFFLSLCYRVFGDAVSLFAPVNVGLSALTAALVVRLGARVFDRGTGVVAGLLWALLPGQVVYATIAQYDVFLTTLVMAAVELVTGEDDPGPRRPRTHLLGGVLAWATLTRPLLLLLPAVVWAYLRWRGRAASAAAVVGIWVLAAAGGWTLRNALLLDHVTLDTHAGYNLWVGNNPLATGTVYHPPDTPDPRLNLSVLGDEVRLDRAGTALALEHIRERPLLFLARIPARIWHLYWTDTTGLYLAGRGAPGAFLERAAFRPYALVMLLAALGLALADWRSAEVRLLAALVGYWTAWTAVTIGVDRFHVPLIPVFCLFAAWALRRPWR